MARSDKMNFRISTGLSIFGLLLLLITVNVIADVRWFRIDLTQDGIFTMSPVTTKLMEDLPDLVTVKAFFSGRVPRQLQHVRRDVKDLLEEYKEYGGGRFRYTFIDPTLDNKSTAELARLGIQPVPYVEEEDNKLVQFGFYQVLVVYYRNRANAIPVGDSTNNLESEITATIKKLTNEQLPTVAFLQGHGESDPFQYYSVVVNDLKNYFVTRAYVRDGKLFPPDVDILIIGEPSEGISPRDLYEIDQFIMRGGKAIFMIDRLHFSTERVPFKLDEKLAGMERLLETYGLHLGDKLIYRHKDHAEQTRGVTNLPPILYPLIFSKPADEHIITIDLTEMPLFIAFPLEFTDPLPSGVKGTVLFETAQEYCAKEGPRYLYQDIKAMPKKEDAVLSSYMTVAMLSGKFKSAFADLPIPPWVSDDGNSSTTDPAERKISEGNSTHIIMIGSSDCIQDQLFSELLRSWGIVNVRNNFKFVRNTVDFLTLGSEMIQIRSRTTKERKLTVKVASGTRTLLQVVNIGALPLLLIGFGLIRFLLRRRRKVEVIRAQAGREPPTVPLKLGRRTKIIVAAGWFAFLIFVIVPIILPSRTDGKIVVGEQKMMLRPFSIETITKLTIEHGNRSVVLSREGVSWVVETRFNHPAAYDRDGAKPDVLLEVLSKLRRGEVRSRTPEAHESYNLQEEKARRVTLYNPEGEAIRSILIGSHDLEAEITYVRLPDEDKVYAVPFLLTFRANADPDAWFRRELCPYQIMNRTPYDPNNVMTFKLEKPGQKDLVLNKQLNGKWRKDSPERDENPDQDDALSIVKNACDLYAMGVVDNTNYKKYGLDEPKATFSLTALAGTVIFHVGGRSKLPDTDEPGWYYIKVDHLPFVYEVDPDYIEDIVVDVNTLKPVRN